MVKKKLILSQDGMGHETVADYFPVVQQTMEDKNQEKLLAGEEKIVFSDGINTNDNSNDSTTNLNQTEEATTMTTKAYTETAEETKKNSKDEGEDGGADKKKEAENNQDTTIGLDAKKITITQILTIRNSTPTRRRQLIWELTRKQSTVNQDYNNTRKDSM